MEISHIALVGIIVCLAGVLQSAIGFGYALFATPLLIWAGMPLTGVITIVVSCSMIQATIGIRKLHAEVPWRLSLIATVIRLSGVILGMFLLKRLLTLNTDYIRAAIGGILCLLVGAQLIWRPYPVKSMHWGWAGLAFAVSGILAGVCGMGGPPLVLWSMAHDWSAKKTRGFLFAVLVASKPAQIVLLYLTFGPSILRHVLIGFVFLPLVYLGSIAGLAIGNHIAKRRLRIIAYGILLIIAVAAIGPAVTALLKEWGIKIFGA